MAMMPLKVYKPLKGGGYEHQDDHPVNYCLGVSPNGWQTPSSFKSDVQSHLIFAGNSVATVRRNGRGQGIALDSYLPINTKFYIAANNRPQYGLRDYPLANTEELLDAEGHRNPTYVMWDAEEVCHFKAFGINKYLGLSVLQVARQSLKLSHTIERFGHRVYNKGRPAGFLTKPGHISDPDRDKLREEWKELYEGVDQAFMVGVLSGGFDWKNIGFTNDDAQFLQNRQFQVLEVARWLRVPPHMLAEIGKATNSNIETLMLQFITFTMLPWVIRWEEELNLKMFTPKERSMGFCCFFDMDAFLRGDSLTRASVHEKQIRNGERTIDQLRHGDRLGPLPNGLGAEPLIIASQLDYLQNVKDGKSGLQGGNKPKPAATTTKTAKASDQTLNSM